MDDFKDWLWALGVILGVVCVVAVIFVLVVALIHAGIALYQWM